MAILSLSEAIIIYQDEDQGNAPLLKYADWRPSFNKVSVENPLVERFIVPPAGTSTVFSGVTSTSIDNTTEFNIALNSTNPSLYRITNTGGTAPAFRTNRTITVGGGLAIDVSVNNNATVEFTAVAGTFSAVQAGDVLFIPTSLTGDSAVNSPFNVVNSGFWSIISVASDDSSFVAIRPPGESFNAVDDSVTVTNANQFVVFSSSGVQVGETLVISSGFSLVTQKSYIVYAVTPTWVEFISTDSLPLESDILPGASGMMFYSNAKRFIRVECDQQAVLRLNGDTSNFIRLSPRVPNNKTGVAWFELWGPVWSLDVVNKSNSSSLNVVLISVE